MEDPNWKLNFNQIDHTIQGKMFGASMTIPEYEREVILSGADGELEIKRRLIDKLIGELYKNMNCVEFTKMNDMMTLETHYKARMFLVPDSQVRIIRQVYNHTL